MDCRPIKASRPEKKVNFQNFVQRFYALQQRLNNNRKPNITIYIWNKNKFAYQKKTKGGGQFTLWRPRLLDISFFNAKIKKKRFSILPLLKINISLKLSLVLLILDVVLHP